MDSRKSQKAISSSTTACVDGGVVGRGAVGAGVGGGGAFTVTAMNGFSLLLSGNWSGSSGCFHSTKIFVDFSQIHFLKK